MTPTSEARLPGSSIPSTARRAGILYVVMSALMIFGYMYVPATFYIGDAAATARKIMEGALMYRVTVLVSLVAQILFIFVVLTLYQLFRDVDRAKARLMVALVCVAVAAEIVNIANRLAPLIMLKDPDFLAMFPKPQLDTLATGYIALGNNLGQFLTAFWGLWLFPFGILVIKSGFFPKILGYLLFASGIGYVVTCFAFIVVPAQLHTIRQFLFPLYFGELGIVLWMAIMGAKVRPDRG